MPQTNFNKLRRYVSALLIGGASWLMSPTAWAGNPLIGNPLLERVGMTSGYRTDVDANTVLFEVLGRIVFAVVSMIGILFILLIIYGGYTWMNARGDETAVKKAKNIIRDAIVGLIVLAASYSVWILFETLLGI